MDRKGLIPPGLVYLADNITSKHNILGAPKGTGDKWAKDLNLPKEAETIFFAGCGYQYISGLESLMSFLRRMDKSAIGTSLPMSIAGFQRKLGIDTAGIYRKIMAKGDDSDAQPLRDAYKVAEVTWRYANYTVPAYVSLVSGPSKTGDIEKVTTCGAHGPKEFHVIFMDAGRTNLAKHPLLRQALYCLRCGGCLFECPVFAVTAGYFGDKYFAGIGAVWAAMISQNMEKAASIAYTCLTCGRCKVRCPMKIDTPEMVIELRRLIAKPSRAIKADEEKA